MVRELCLQGFIALHILLNKINDYSRRQIIGFVLFLYFLCAFCSSGVQHPDEHFQIFPPLLAKLNGLKFSELAWEYREKMRSYLLPAFFWTTSFLPQRLGLAGPFFTVILSRMTIAFLSVFSTFVFCKNYFRENRILIMPSFLFLLLCWYVPFLHIRTSSENFSFILFLVGTSIHLGRNQYNKYLAVFWTFFFFYLSFHSRMQNSLMILGFLFFNLKRFQAKDYFFAVIGTSTALALSVAIDFWGYHEIVFTPWHYFYQNIILKKSHIFGEMPVWYYFSSTFLKSYVLFWPLFFWAVATYFYKFKKSLITFILTPFIIGHLFIAHKELRFLSALYFFIPLMLFELWINPEIKTPKVFRPGKCYFILNLFFLAFATLVPASKDEDFYRALDFCMASDQNIYVDNKDFTLEMSFFNPKKITLAEFKLAPSGDYYFLATEYLSFLKTLERPGCSLLYSSYKPWIIQSLPLKVKGRSTVLGLFKCLRV